MQFVCTDKRLETCHVWQDSFGQKTDENIIYVKLLHKKGDEILWSNHLHSDFDSKWSQMNHNNSQIILIGTDLLFLPRYSKVSNKQQIITKLVAFLSLILQKKTSILWKIRGGIVSQDFPSELSIFLKTLPRKKILYVAKLEVEVALSTMDSHALRKIEGAHVSLPDERIRLMQAFQSRSVSVVLLLDPLLPLLNDLQANLLSLFHVMNDIGVQNIRSSYFILTRHREKMLSRRKARMTADMILAFFINEAWRKAAQKTKQHARMERHKLLPQHLRKAGQDRILELAKRFDFNAVILDPIKASEIAWQNDRHQRKDRLYSRVKKVHRKSRRQQLRERQLNLF